MIENRTKVRIAEKTITVPIYHDRRTTLRLAKRLDERIQEIEKASERIDTQAFALEAALSFAAELAAAEQEREDETTQAFKDRGRWSKPLDEILRKYGLPDRKSAFVTKTGL